MGDYNTTFEQSERIGTTRTKNELKVANKINLIMEILIYRIAGREQKTVR